MKEGKISILNLFQSYRPSKILQEYFEDVYIDKVRFSKRSKVLHIFVISHHLIHQQYVRQLEQELLPYARNAVGGAKSVTLQLEFQLSERYQLKEIFEEYEDSLLYEIKEADPINYLLVKDEAWVVNDNVITIPMPDSDLAKCRVSEIQEFLINLFGFRFQMDIQVGFNFKEEDKEALREAHEKRLQQEREQHQKQLEQLRANELAQHDRTEESGHADKTNHVEDNGSKTASSSEKAEGTKHTRETGNANKNGNIESIKRTPNEKTDHIYSW